jgi:serine/threonine protein phosphatase PrpC
MGSAAPEDDRRMFLRATGCSHVGMRRQVNEDRYALAPDLGLFVVADGMGGHTAGQVASELATSAALAAVRSLKDGQTAPSDCLRQAIASANQRVLDEVKSRPELTGMGTTMVMLMATGSRATLAHVGDSRAYLIRDRQMRRLTTDHSLVGELVRRGRIDEAEAREHPHRHVLTRAIGVRDSVEPAVGEMSALAGDVFVLCSDGLTTHLEDEEIASLAEAEPDLNGACQNLVDAANARGGQDNTTIVMLRYECEREAKRE